MKRRKVVLTIEAETVLTIAELKKLQSLVCPNGFLHVDPKLESAAGAARGTITQVQVNVIRK